jgi:hypothetical protein
LKPKKEQSKKTKKKKPEKLTLNGNRYFIPESESLVSDLEWEFFIDWLWTVAPEGDSNSPERLLIWITWAEAHLEYQKEAQLQGIEPRSLPWFIKYCKTQKVKKGKFDRYRCIICCQGLKAITNMTRNPSQENIATKQTYLEHVDLYKTQFSLYSAQLNQLPKGKAFVIFDYSTIHETCQFKLKDLNFTTYWRTDEGKLAHTFFDFWSESKKDYKFTIKAFYSLISLPFFRQFNEIIMWGDGGLKTKEILYYFSEIASQFRTPIHINYFAPHHGHSVCDAHFGQGKKMLRQVVGSK